ncbi:MAG: 3-hydroxyacyl-ACP dehydratase FabZ [Bacillota bacterium]|nr:3-hydroxyacyl-ACP dehydratase FabZ [Bacillota bacterium]
MLQEPLDIKRILSVLPHRYPFLMVDKITELEPGQKASGIKNVTINEPFFQGHFSGEPVMPGVMIVESLAQVGAVAVLSLKENENKLALFTGINNFRFKQVVKPGDQLYLTITMTGMRRNIGKGEAEAQVDGKVVASGELWFALIDRDKV